MRTYLHQKVNYYELKFERSVLEISYFFQNKSVCVFFLLVFIYTYIHLQHKNILPLVNRKCIIEIVIVTFTQLSLYEQDITRYNTCRSQHLIQLSVSLLRKQICQFWFATQENGFHRKRPRLKTYLRF